MTLRGPTACRAAWRPVPALLLAALLAGCGSAPPKGAMPAPAAPGGRVLAQSERYIVYLPVAGDTLQSLAAAHLGDAARAWQIAEFNGTKQVEPGQALVLPLQMPNPLGVAPDHLQTVPILCYHRFGPTSGKVSQGLNKMTVSSANFAAQLEWLARNDYQVIRLSQLLAFLEGRQALPKRTVVITIDDGYESVYRYAFPLLKRHGMPATVFMYTDFIGSRDGLTWAQLEEMSASGWVDIQAHSKSHRNLTERAAGETEERYRQALDTEVRVPREQLERRLNMPVRWYAFPFGDANDAVLDTLERHRYDLAVTVNPGGNPFYAHPFMLRRTMIFGDHDLGAFQARLQITRPLSQP